MMESLPGVLLAMAAGVGVALLNAAMTKAVLRKKPDRVASFFTVRQIINVAYLAIVFFASRVLPWDSRYMLAGAALGLTVPSLLLSFRLARGYDGQKSEASDETKGEE